MDTTPDQPRNTLPRAAWGRLIVGLVAAHVFMVMATSVYPAGDNATNDPRLYEQWTTAWLHQGHWPDMSDTWAYPFGALAPLLSAYTLAALAHAPYVATWVAMVAAIDALVLIALVRWAATPADGHRAARWWILFLCCLGPVHLYRLEAITIPLVVLALRLVMSKPGTVGALFTAGAWIKVWPAAALSAIWLTASTTGHRIRLAAISAALTLAMTATALALGSGSHVFDFITTQQGRGLQVEAVAATPFWWTAALLGSHNVYYDTDVLASQITGPGTTITATIVGWTMWAATAIVAVAIVRARRAGAPPVELVHTAVLAMVTTWLVWNKVGSPQYADWFAASIAVGLCLGLPNWRRLATITLVIAALTQFIYPLAYPALVDYDLTSIAVLTVRNLLLAYLWAVAVYRCWTLAPRTSLLPNSRVS